MTTVVTILAALYLVWIGTIMKATNCGHVALFIFKAFPVIIGFLLVFPVLKQFM